MAFLPPIELPDLIDLCPAWLDSVFRKHENIVDEESTLAAAEAELTHRVSEIFSLGFLLIVRLGCWSIRLYFSEV